MTMTEWITQTLPVSIRRVPDANGEMQSTPCIELESVAEGDIWIPIATLGGILGSVTIPPTHAALSALPIAGAGGWQKYFDAWKAQGLIT